MWSGIMNDNFVQRSDVGSTYSSIFAYQAMEKLKNSLDLKISFKVVVVFFFISWRKSPCYPLEQVLIVKNPDLVHAMA
jgi:hypothetical protein